MTAMIAAQIQRRCWKPCVEPHLGFIDQGRHRQTQGKQRRSPPPVNERSRSSTMSRTVFVVAGLTDGTSIFTRFQA